MGYGSGLTRGSVSLTHRTIEALRPAEAPYRVSDQRCTGLAVRVAPSGLKTWDLAYRIRAAGKVRRVSLGRVSDVSLEDARDRANAVTRAARAGSALDPRDLQEFNHSSRADYCVRSSQTSIGRDGGLRILRWELVAEVERTLDVSA